MADETTSREPMVLVALGDPEQRPRLYACSTCGQVNSPAIYMATPERQHEAAREAARDCYNFKTHNSCQYCGVDCSKHSLACADCIIAKKLESAEEVPDDGGPYFGFEGERMYHHLEEAQADGLEWVMPSTVSYPRIDADNIFENLTADMFEDASTDDLVGTGELTVAIAKFNEAQTTVTYWGDHKRKIRVSACVEEGEAA